MSSEYEPPPGHLGNLTPDQQRALEQLQAELIKEGWLVEARHDEATLLRFLRARKFDVAKAKEMFIASEKWRKEFEVDNLVKSARHYSEFDYSLLMGTFIRNFRFKEKEAVNKLYPQYYHKTDKVCSFLMLDWLHPPTSGWCPSARMFLGAAAPTSAPRGQPESNHSHAAGEGSGDGMSGKEPHL